MRDIDTAFNYADFSSHARLSAMIPDLLPEFHLSTKVGFFPSSTGHSEHSLEPARIRRAMEKSVDALGRVPDVVFLHNPERSVREAGAGRGQDLFLEAARTLNDAVQSGLCAEWGISTWDARPLVDALGGYLPDHAPRPAHLMHRSGVLASPAVWEAADSFAGLLRVDVRNRWGMSPFGGDTRQSFWESLNLASLLSARPPFVLAVPQVAFRLAYELPPAARVAVSLNRLSHLRQLVEAARLDVDQENIERYRVLLRNRRPLDA
ncbi:putative oxidoreductase, aryl-alcohol dehydrogenase like protein [Frankia sp. CcI6]|uniref:aldo/keto reductase n=1 Tax=Frankia TaxID=1854 RepID=UPI0003D05D5F|nr:MULTISPECIES: aldo/keto reductase [unclassified Frankia]ETA02153.1 putative oxidoreductase, aryl-alcohol dehydrogenase like protein [Frankia sp. CcI6]KFB05970.1 putative oxidoreductase, aryl-alcohol dehydrogenase like protein [Frankia sp. Allo2]OAA28913.1 putative oxidoreductase, aryl-alcohol dehydrogenase like protein [Frankia casuarinae]